MQDYRLPMDILFKKFQIAQKGVQGKVSLPPTLTATAF